MVDIDSSDDRLLAKVEARFGLTPFRVRTPSGGAIFTSGTPPEAITERQRCSDVGLAATMTADMIEMVVTGASAEAIQEHLQAVIAALERHIAAMLRSFIALPRSPNLGQLQ